MSGQHEVDCNGCGRHYQASFEQARKQRVLRCACGQFVRLDRALKERLSDPAQSAATDLESAMGGSREEQASLLASAAGAGGRARSRTPEPGVLGDERVSRAVPRSTLNSLSQAQWRAPATPSDKPLWYVDLGGSETVEMTIEQVIIARRSGKLGEGALVWREGMANWRPVGTLIPANSADRSLTPIPPAAGPVAPPRTLTPSRVENPKPAAEPALPTLGSYERPLATLEFALETPANAAPVTAARSPLPSRVPPRVNTPLPRRNTPLPRPNASPTSGASRVGPAPQPAPVAAAEVPAPAPRVAPLATPFPSTPAPTLTRALSELRQWSFDRPRWVAACIALTVCIVASGSGALLVRSLKQHKEPLTLTANAAPQSAANAHATSRPSDAASPPASATQPLVVNVESLSVEHGAARPAPRPVAPVVPRVPSVKPAPELDDESTPTTSAPAPTQAKPAKLKDSDLPAAARANPYVVGNDDDTGANKTPAPNGDNPDL